MNRMNKNSFQSDDDDYNAEVGNKAYLVKKFLTTFAIVGVILGITAATIVFLVASLKSEPVNADVAKPNGISGSEESVNQAEGNKQPSADKVIDEETKEKLTIPEITNVLILGLDEGGQLADVDIVASFNIITGYMSFITVPRDTKVTLSGEQKSQLKEWGRSYPSSGVVKLTELHSYAGKEHGGEMSRGFVENLLDIEIQYYVEIDTQAFREIVDAVGGIYFEVPKGGLYDNDPTQKFSVNLNGGYQLLNGKQAEGLVRYRKTYNGDLPRTKVQQDFIAAFMDQVLSQDTITKNLLAYFNTLSKYVKTDYGFDDLMNYGKYIEYLDPGKIQFVTAPGDPKLIGDAWYYIVDVEGTRSMVSELMQTDIRDSSKVLLPEEMKVQILNGGGAKGIASEKRDVLVEAGFNVADIGDYKGDKTAQTRIISRNIENCKHFGKFFEDAVSEEDADLTNKYDVVIIIGKDEK